MWRKELGDIKERAKRETVWDVREEKIMGHIKVCVCVCNLFIYLTFFFHGALKHVTVLF